MSDEGFADFESFDEPSIRLPYKGTEYELRPVDAQFALWIESAAAGAKTPLKDMSDEDQLRRLIGPSYDDMLADGVSAKFFARAQQVAMTELKAGRKAAEMVWRTGVDPELIAAAVAAAQAEESNSTGEDGKTPTPASTSGTTSRKKPQDRKAPASRSRTSSGSGGRSKRTGGSTTAAT